MNLPDKSPDGSAPVSTAKKTSQYINGACLILAVVGLGLVSNRLLDMGGVAEEPGLSTDERKEKARRNQEGWDRSAQRSSGKIASKMCGDVQILQRVKTLINEQTPNIGQLGETLRKLDASRGNGLEGVIRAREDHIRKTKEMYKQDPIDPNSRYVGNPVEERAKHLAELEADLARLKAKQAEEASRPKSSIQITENEIILTSDPAPVEFDPVTNRTACKVTYKVKGFGYDNPGVQLSTPTTAVYTLQQAADDWIVQLVALN